VTTARLPSEGWRRRFDSVRRSPAPEHAVACWVAPAGRYALRVTGRDIEPLRQAVRLQNRRTLRATVYLTMRDRP
jgi:hypothetical protein